MPRNGEKKQRIRPTLTAPSGLTECVLGQVDGEESERRSTTTRLLDVALAQVEALLCRELAEQIAQNRHCFINLPFPLEGLTREQNTPLFTLDDPEVSAISELVQEAMSATGLSNTEIQQMLPRANIIVREYLPGQQISFHTDHATCDAVVVGVVLLNEAYDPQLPPQGLHFRRGQSKHTLQYIVREQRGTAFLMADEARYVWQHGLPPVPARRISVTARFFRQQVLDAARAAAAARPLPTTTRSTTSATELPSGSVTSETAVE